MLSFHRYIRNQGYKFECRHRVLPEMRILAHEIYKNRGTLKPSCHIPFTHVFFALRCVFEVITWASAPMGKTRHLPGPRIWHWWNFRYKIANLKRIGEWKVLKQPFAWSRIKFAHPKKLLCGRPWIQLYIRRNHLTQCFHWCIKLKLMHITIQLRFTESVKVVL